MVVKEGDKADWLYIDEYRRLFQAYNKKFKVSNYMNKSKAWYMDKLKELRYEPYWVKKGGELRIDLRPTKDMMRRPQIKANVKDMGKSRYAGGRNYVQPPPKPKPKPKPRGRPKGAKNKKGTIKNPNPNYKK
tara:strand:- start:780 stop:1175 length:396 start_codon:yes stop_codon:yes gene_type:complete